jgi:hypothetical protein
VPAGPNGSVKILFWLLVIGDIAGLLVLFLLGLAAAPSSRTSPLAVAATMLLVPAALQQVRQFNGHQAA